MTKELILRWEIILIILVSPPNEITRVLTWERGRQRSHRCDNGSKHWSDGGPRVKECRQLLEARKGEEMGSPLDPPE